MSIDPGRRWLLWLGGLILFFIPFLAPLTPLAMQPAPFSAAAAAEKTWRVAGEGQGSLQQPALSDNSGAQVVGASLASDRGLTTIFRWSSQALWRSADQGQSWTVIGAGLPRTVTGALTLVDLQPGGVHTLYALAGPAGRRGLYRSTDSGASFELLNQPLDFNPTLLAVHPSAGGDSTVLAGDDTIVLSLDGGASWRDFHTPGRILALAIGERGLWAAGDGKEGEEASSSWLAYTAGQGDAAGMGERWQLHPLPTGVQAAFLAAAARGPVQLYLGHAGGLLNSSDGGSSWQPVLLPSGLSPAALVLDPLIWQAMVLLDANGRIWRSDDAGASWRALPIPAGGAVRRLFLAPGDRDRLYAVAGFDLWWLPQSSLQPTPTLTATASPTPTLTAIATASRAASPTSTRVTPASVASPTPTPPASATPTAPATRTPARNPAPTSTPTHAVSLPSPTSPPPQPPPPPTSIATVLPLPPSPTPAPPTPIPTATSYR